MPNQTFFHLSKDKQDTLIQAAKKEFSRVPLHEASIANIIKDAGIPRGSFYQYFEDKEDLFFYLLNNLAQINNERTISLLKEKKGDLFETSIVSYQHMIMGFRNPGNKNLFKNAFLNMNYKLEKTIANDIYEESQRSQYLETIKLINTQNLNIKDEPELHQVIKIIWAVTFQNLIQLFVKDLTDEEALNNYVKQIELLKKGLYKDNDK